MTNQKNFLVFGTDICYITDGGDFVTLAEKLKQLREQRGMTQKQVAELMGISQQAYGQYESGSREPKPDTLGRIAAALGTSPSNFFENSFVSDIESQENYLNDFIHGQLAQTVKEQRIFDKVLRQSPVTAELWDAFCLLNEKGQQVAVERVQELAQIPQYKLENSHNYIPDLDKK